MLMNRNDGKEIRSYIDKAIREYIERDSYKVARQSIKDNIENMIIGEFYTKIRNNVENTIKEIYESKLNYRILNLIKKYIPPNIIYVNEYKDPPAPLAPLKVIRFEMSSIASGIYFLCRDDRIVYIGQAVDLSRRIPQHLKEKNFDRVFYINVKEEDLNNVEIELIKYYQPEYNKTSNRAKDLVQNERQRR